MCCCIEFDKNMHTDPSLSRLIPKLTKHHPPCHKLFPSPSLHTQLQFPSLLLKTISLSGFIVFATEANTTDTNFSAEKKKKIKGLFMRNCVSHCSILMLKKVRFSAALVPSIYEPIWQLITHAWRYWLLRVLWHTLMLIDVFRWTRVGITTQYK